MKDNIKSLIKEFMRIKEMGWIKTKRKGTTGIGYTFETLLNKPEENFELPDYGNIEIKTKHKYSKGNITLFNATPDGDNLFPIKTLQQKYGYPDKTLPKYLVFKGSIKGNQLTQIGANYRFTLSIDKIHKKVRLLIVNRDNEIISQNISWSFELLKEKLQRKLKYLAIVKANCKIQNNVEYFNYVNINLYKLEDFDKFLQLLENGTIRITFKIGVFKSGTRQGQTHDHGTGFDINEVDILQLYKKIEYNDFFI